MHPGDLVILIAYGQMEDEEARTRQPRVVFVDADNKVIGTGTDPAEALLGTGLTRGDVASPPSWRHPMDQREDHIGSYDDDPTLVW